MSLPNNLVNHPTDCGLYTNIDLAPTAFKTKNKSSLQMAWDNMYTHLQKTILKRVSSPYAVYMGVGNIKFFDYDKSVASVDVIRKLNKKGLKIYLYEPISTYTTESKGLYAEYETGTTKVLSYELDSIQSYVKRNGLTNVQVYTPNHDIKKYFQKHYPNIALFCTPIGWIYPATINI